MTHAASIFVLGVVVFLGGWYLVAAIHAAPTTQPEPSTLDRADGVGQRCTRIDCDQPATAGVHAGHDWYPMCPTHALPYLRDTGGLKCRDVFDQELATPDFRAWEAELREGAA